MSSDGKPLWGFRKIYFFQGILLLFSSVWGTADLIALWRLKAMPLQELLVVASTATLLAALGVASVWFWRELRQGKFSQRNWLLGLMLLGPSIIFLPFGIFCIVNWCAKTCRSHFHD